ncbi:MAG: GAF domain-containing sensor histidine kinase [Anaerolineae bacterium]|nr:GAF domain-containing sensor histidine kinase [Anaerolineae bacterium]
MLDSAEQLKQRNRELSILNVIAEALNRELDLSRALSTALTEIVSLFNLHTGWIWLVNEETDTMYLAAALNLPPVLADKPSRLEGWCHCRETYESGDMEGAANVNIIQCSRLKGIAKGTDGLRAHASVPLYSHGKRLGIVNVVSSDWRELSPDDLRLLYTVGDLLSIAIERARLFARSTQLGALEERARLAREIHDTLAQGMSAITLQLETADALLETGMTGERLRQTIQRALSLTRQNLEEARRSVQDLRAASLDNQPLPDALRSLIHSLTTGSNLLVKLGVSDELPPLPPRIEAALYRLVQETVTNVVQHAKAKELEVQLNASEHSLHLIVVDDGQGFDPANAPQGRFGLIGLNERARLLGGTAEICSAPGTGTAVQITIPLGGEA